MLIRTGLTITAVGDIEEAELARQLDRAFGGLPLGTAPQPLPDWTPTSKARSVNVERAVPQSAILIAMPGIPRDDPDWYAYLVMSNILGGGQQSRLFSEVREKRGLAYGVSAGIRTYRKASLMVISSGSANEKVAETLRVIRNELVRLRTEGVSVRKASRRSERFTRRETNLSRSSCATARDTLVLCMWVRSPIALPVMTPCSPSVTRTRHSGMEIPCGA